MNVFDLKPTKLIQSNLADPPLNLSRVSMKTALWVIIQPIFMVVFWLTLQSAEGQLWAILVCSTPISSHSFTPLLSSSMKNSARTSSPAKWKGAKWKVLLNANETAFSHGQPWKTTQWQLGRVLYKLPQPHIVNYRHPRSPNKDHVDWIHIGNTNYNS